MANIVNRINSVNPKLLRFSVLMLFFGLAFSSYQPFVVVFLSARGYSNEGIGTILAINALILVIAQPFWGMISDKIQSTKKVFVLCLLTAALLACTLPFFNSILIIGLIMAIVSFFDGCLVPLLDSWVVQGIKTEKGITYGYIRLWMSAGFTVMVLILGKMVDAWSVNVIFISYVLSAILTALFSTRIKGSKPTSHVSFKSLKVGRLVKNYYYVTFILFATILFIPYRSAFLFFPKIIESLGGSKADYGIAMSVTALSEVPVFLFSNYLLKRFKPIQLILVSAGFFTLRQFFFAIATLPVHAIAIQATQGLCYGLFLTGTVYYVDYLAPDELKATAQGLAYAIFYGGSGVIGSFASGWLIDRVGFGFMFTAGTFVSLGISLLFILSFPAARLFQNRYSQVAETSSME